MGVCVRLLVIWGKKNFGSGLVFLVTWNKPNTHPLPNTPTADTHLKKSRTHPQTQQKIHGIPSHGDNPHKNT